MAFLLNLPNQGGLQHIKIDHYEVIDSVCWFVVPEQF